MKELSINPRCVFQLISGSGFLIGGAIAIGESKIVNDLELASAGLTALTLGFKILILMSRMNEVEQERVENLIKKWENK